MRIIVVDDEELILKHNVSLCRKLSEKFDVIGFTRPSESLEYLKSNKADIAILDINMPGIDGIELAVRMKLETPDIRIIFLTAYSEYAVEAFKIHASGYLLKPVNQEDLSKEIDYAIKTVPQKDIKSHVFIRTFGEFDVFVDGEPMSFKRNKSKELLAYLVDRQGGSVTRASLFAMLCEEKGYDRAAQKYLDVIIRSMRQDLKEKGIDNIVKMSGGFLRVCPDKFECDLYRLLEGEAASVNAFHGEYMNSYSWAGVTEAYIKRSKED
ncbi:MAG: response regulator [Clostridiales bacterium]|nr:response regulator [Clostridiales bacterium]